MAPTAQTAVPRESPTSTLVAFILGHFGHHLATAATVPLLPMIRDSFQMDYFRSGLLLSAFSLTYSLLQLPVAAISDRTSKRLILSLGLVGIGVSCVGVAAAQSYEQLVVALLLMGVAGSTYHAPSSAFVSQAFGKAARGRALGLHIVGGSCGLMAAPVVAILVSNLTGSWRAAFLALSVPLLLFGGLLWIACRSEERRQQERVEARRGEPIRWIEVVRALGALVSIAVLSQLLVAGMNSFLPLYLVDKHGASQEVGGLALTLIFAAGVLSAPIAGILSDRVGRKPVILLSVAGVGPPVLLVAMLPFGPAMAGAIALYGLFQVLRLPATESLIADVVPAHRRATVLGVYQLLTQQTTGIATPALGWSMDQFGLQATFNGLAAIGLATSIVSVALWRKL